MPLGPRRRSFAISAIFAICAAFGMLAALLGGCLYDSDDRCGPNMAYLAQYSICVCLPNAVPVRGGCAACAADEVAMEGVCACPAGQAKNADGVCVGP